MTLTAQQIESNPFAACNEVGANFGLKKLSEDKYVGLFLKGNCPLHDYGAGVLWVSLEVYRKWDDPRTWQVRLYVGNADDGGLGSWVYSTSQESSRLTMQDVVDVFNAKFPKILPDLDTMNTELVKYGVYVVWED